MKYLKQNKPVCSSVVYPDFLNVHMKFKRVVQHNKLMKNKLTFWTKENTVRKAELLFQHVCTESTSLS